MAFTSDQATSTYTQTARSRRLEKHLLRRGRKPPRETYRRCFLTTSRTECRSLPYVLRKLCWTCRHYMEMLTYAKYPYVTTNLQLRSRSEGEKVLVLPNTFKEAIKRPESALWKVASGKTASREMHHVYDLVLLTSIPAGKKSVGSRWVFKQDGQGLQGRACWPRLGTSRRSRL